MERDNPAIDSSATAALRKEAVPQIEKPTTGKIGEGTHDGLQARLLALAADASPRRFS
jgi:hypothetical protein